MEASPGEAHRNILLILLTPIGDTVFALPAVRALRKAYPGARISAVVFPTNRAVLENSHDVDRLIVHATRETWPGLPAYLRFFADRRRERYDLLVQFAPYHDYYGLVAHIPQQARLPAPWLSWLVPNRNRRWKAMHAVERYLEALRPLGIPRADGFPRMETSAVQEVFAGTLLTEHGVRPAETLVGIHAGGSGFKGMKRWSPAGFARVARSLNRQRPVRLVFFGSEAERCLAKAVIDEGTPGGAINLCGRTTLSQTVALLARLDLFIGNDSGPLHMAAALGTPALGIFGPTNASTFAPRGPFTRIVQGTVGCPANYDFFGVRPFWAYPECQGECLESIDPAGVHRAAEELLAEAASSREKSGRWGARTLDLSDVNAAL